MDFKSDVITLERQKHVATLWLDNPDNRNAMGPDLWADLPVAISALSSDADVRAVVIAAKGSAFTVGLDLKTMGGTLFGSDGESSQAAQNQKFYDDVRRLQASITSVADCPKPVIAAAHGYCIGGGIDLITACDIRLAAADTIFSVRETRMALVADLGTLQRLPKIVAAGHAAELIYSGNDVDAERARHIGLVNDVYPDAQAVYGAAVELASQIAANSPLAVQGSKAVLRASEGRTVAESLDYTALWNTSFLKSHDLREAVTAFLEKRAPEFRGE